MMQSTFHNLNPNGLHVAVIMDGNGRWAACRNLPRTDGHRAGAESVRRVVKAAPALGIGTLSLYAFSSDNWQRPKNECSTLMALLRSQLLAEKENCLKNSVKISFFGRRDRLSPAVRKAVETVEAATKEGRRLHLRIAVDYSARESILQIVQGLNGKAASPLAISSQLGPAVDLLIRTGGEQRLSDFLLWECAYAELYFTPKKWPDFTEKDLQEAIAEFKTRQRRFGRLPKTTLTKT